MLKTNPEVKPEDVLIIQINTIPAFLGGVDSNGIEMESHDVLVLGLGDDGRIYAWYKDCGGQWEDYCLPSCPKMIKK
jgi:uncharacterized membrane protein